MGRQLNQVQFKPIHVFLFIGIIAAPAIANYQSQEGRWMQQDPMQYVDGLNLYEYVKSLPVVCVDAFGLLGMISFTFGTEWPLNSYFADIARGEKIYNTITPSPVYIRVGSSEYRGNEATLAKNKAWLNVWGGEFKDWPDASRFLRHYLGNTGDLLDSNYPKMINEDKAAYWDYRIIRNQAIDFVRAHRIATSIGHIVSTSDVQADRLETLNWHYALGGYKIAAKASNITCNSMTLELELRDYYDWNKEDKKAVGAVSPSELYGLHVWGYAKFFKVLGYYTTFITWDNSGAVTNEWEGK